jgi:hypothetical protein
MNQPTRTYLLLEVQCSKEIPELTDKAAGRVYTMSGIEGATAILLDSQQAFKLASAQMEKGRG